MDDVTSVAGEIASGCLAVRLRALNRALSAIYDEELRPLGLKASQMNVLTAVGLLGEVRPRDLARGLHMDPSTLSRNVDRMRVRGWIEVVPGADGREQRLRLTDEGGELLLRAKPAWDRAQERSRDLLGEGGDRAVHDLYGALSNP